MLIFTITVMITIMFIITVFMLIITTMKMIMLTRRVIIMIICLLVLVDGYADDDDSDRYNNYDGDYNGYAYECVYAWHV